MAESSTSDPFFEKAQQYMNLRTVILTSLISAFGFVLALFWNEAVKAAIEQIVPRADTLTAKFAAAIIVTIIVVIIIYVIIYFQRVTERRLQDLARKRPARVAEMRRRQAAMRRDILEGSQ